MSKRNNQASKAAARERLREERERQAKKDKARRQIIVGASIVGVLAVAGGAGFLIMQANKDTGWEAAAKAKVVAPANTSGKNGSTVTIGDAAKNTVHLYEDARCPACASMEQTFGKDITKGMEDGEYKLSFTIGTFLDGNLGGDGSKNALSALGAALNVSPEAFLDYKEALYSAEYHPEESSDEFAKDDYLIKVANTVDALKDKKGFQNDVKSGKYDAWAMKMSDTFQSAKDVTGTPTIKINDKKIETPSDAAAWKAALKSAGVTK